MLLSSRVQLALLVLSAAAAISRLRAAESPPSSAVESVFSSYSFPVFNDATTDDGLVVVTNSSILSPATFLFDAQLFPEFNESEGFVLLAQTVDLWRAAARREASFNTSFMVAVDGSSVSGPVAFVVVLDSFPLLNTQHGRRGTNSNNSVVSAGGVAVPNATDSFATVEVGTVDSYSPRSPGVGLNVTITPNRTSPSLAVRIEYNAIAHRLCVYVGAAGDPREPHKALLNAPLNLAGGLTTQTAFVGFFAATVRDVVVGIRDWELTVDRFPDDNGRRDEPKKESTLSSSWLVILLAVVGSVAAVAAAVISVVVCFLLSRRRAFDMELKQCYSNYFARRRL